MRESRAIVLAYLGLDVRLSSVDCLVLLLKVQVLKDSSNALAAANTSCYQTKPGAAPFQFVHQLYGQNGPGSADRMAQGHRTAVDIYFIYVHFEFADTCQSLGRESLVQFNQVKLIQTHPGLRQGFQYRRNRAY